MRGEESQKMESWFCSRWIYLWTIITQFTNTWADVAPPPHYSFSLGVAGFEQAAGNCSPGGLTTLATDQEVSAILKLVPTSAAAPGELEASFWVGLRKEKNQCVVPSLPLKGFKWLEDGGEEAQLIQWAGEPEHTCTSVRCVMLKVRWVGSAVTWWGLNSVSCKHHHRYICKLGNKPHLPPATPVTPHPPKPDPGPATLKPQQTAAEPQPPTQGPEPETSPGPASDPDSEPVPWSDSCQPPLISGARSLSLDPDNSSRIQVECWSSVQLGLHCSGRPAVWRLLDDSPANFTTVCQQCDDGFQKNASGNCVDVDECAAAAGRCRLGCLNTQGSYRCVCFDEDGKHHDEDSPACEEVKGGGWMSGVLIPAVVAVAALVLLVVIVAVTVKCILMKRSKKRATDRALKVPMKSKDGKDYFETANEKVAT